MEKCDKVAALYLATLRAMSIIHQRNHWTTHGDNFYSDHLLFDRIYESTNENIDTAAEKFMGLFGDDFLDYNTQTGLLNKVLLKYKELNISPVEMSLAIEKDFLKFSKDAYNCFEEEDRLTLGLDDMITSISGTREESVYLLQQVLDEQ